MQIDYYSLSCTNYHRPYSTDWLSQIVLYRLTITASPVLTITDRTLLTDYHRLYCTNCTVHTDHHRLYCTHWPSQTDLHTVTITDCTVHIDNHRLCCTHWPSKTVLHTLTITDCTVQSDYHKLKLTITASPVLTPSVKTKTFGQRSFSYAGPVIWNKLPY